MFRGLRGWGVVRVYGLEVYGLGQVYIYIYIYIPIGP